MDYDFELVIMTCGERGTPHRAVISAANPGLTIHVWSGEETGLDGWRNCDRNMREFWRAKRAEVAAQKVLFIEYDVFANVALGPLMPALQKGCGIVCAAVKSPVRDGRSWFPFQETNRLPAELQSVVIGTAPMAVLLCDRAALDAVLDAKWDAVFEADVFCEIRLGTIMRSEGFSVVECSAWRGVGTRPMVPPGGASGIYHPVKMEVQS